MSEVKMHPADKTFLEQMEKGIAPSPLTVQEMLTGWLAREEKAIAQYRTLSPGLNDKEFEEAFAFMRLGIAEGNRILEKVNTHIKNICSEDGT